MKSAQGPVRGGARLAAPPIRALTADPSAVPAARYRRFVRRAQVEALLADHLVQGEPYLALNAVLLGSEDAELLRRLSVLFSRAFCRAAQALAENVPRLGELGFPWVAAELLTLEPPRVPLIGRFDFVPDQQGHWWLLEFNADTPSGVREAIVVDRLVFQLSPADRLRRSSDQLARSLVAAFEAALEQAAVGPGEALGLVTTASELEDLAQMAFTRHLLHAPLAARGVGVILGDIANLRGTRQGLTLCGRPIQALYRYVPFESMLGTQPFVAIYDALAAGQVSLLNGLFGLLLQHKGVLAWLWEHRDDPALPADERAAICEHLAPSWPIDQVPSGTGQQQLVAKQVFGREGEEVFFGEDLSSEAWQTLRRRRTYLAQQRISIASFEAAIPTSAGTVRQAGHATVGAYVVDGAPAGFYTRFGGKVITSRAKWMATFEEQESIRND